MKLLKTQELSPLFSRCSTQGSKMYSSAQHPCLTSDRRQGLQLGIRASRAALGMEDGNKPGNPREITPHRRMVSGEKSWPLSSENDSEPRKLRKPETRGGTQLCCMYAENTEGGQNFLDCTHCRNLNLCSSNRQHGCLNYWP